MPFLGVLRSIERASNRLGMKILLATAVGFSMGFAAGGAAAVDTSTFEYDRVNESTVAVEFPNGADHFPVPGATAGASSADNSSAASQEFLPAWASGLDDPLERAMAPVYEFVAISLYRVIFGSANVGVRAALALPSWVPTSAIGAMSTLGVLGGWALSRYQRLQRKEVR